MSFQLSSKFYYSSAVVVTFFFLSFFFSSGTAAGEPEGSVITTLGGEGFGGSRCCYWTGTDYSPW